MEQKEDYAWNVRCTYGNSHKSNPKMLYQSGYLTIKENDGYSYTLGYPNQEVRDGFANCLMPYYASEEVLSQIDSKGYLIPYTVTKDKNGEMKKLF